MTEILNIHPVNPEPRLVRRAVAALRDGVLIVYPTDSCYAFGCLMGDRNALQRIQQIRQTDRAHNFTLVCRDLSEIASYARVDNTCYRLLRANTPGPYTFILSATRDVPRRLQNPRRRTIGIRVPDHAVPQAILEELGEPIMSSTLLLPGDDRPLTDPDSILEALRGRVDLVIGSGSCSVVATTVVDLTSGHPIVLREGKGPVGPFS